jgi:hypothetical protein
MVRDCLLIICIAVACAACKSDPEPARKTRYNSTGSGLDAANVQEALDQLSARVASLNSEVTSLTEEVAANTTLAESNASGVAANATQTSSNAAAISTNGTTIASNATDIGTNSANIATNTGDIAGHDTTLGTHQSQLDSLAATETLHRATFSGDDGADSGVLTGRELTFTKALAASELLIVYYDSFRAWKGSDASCSWEILINGEPCTSPSAIRQDLFVDLSQNIHRADTVSGICAETTSGAIGAGSVTLTVEVSTTFGAGTDCYTGWSTLTGFLMAQEVLP